MPSQPHQHQHHIITPWRQPSDLLRIRTSLYSPKTPQEQTHAIATVHAWKLRGNVPHAIESTALLMDAMLLHATQTSTSAAAASTTTTTLLLPTTQIHQSQSSADFSCTSSFALRAAYTTALSRFVTGFADLGRHRNGVGQSMFDVAKAIGLPAHFVELRHEVAHEDMPGLARLVRSAREAVDWLWGVYWARLDPDVGGGGGGGRGLEMGDGDVGFRQTLLDYLKGFRSGRVAAIKAKGRGRAVDDKMEGLLLETQQLCQRLCSDGDNGARWLQLASVLVDEGLMIPSLKQAKGPLADSALHGAYMLWDDLLQMLASGSSHFIEAFFERAVAFNATLTTTDAAQDNVNPAKWAMYRWIMHLLNSDDWEKVRNESPMAFEMMVLRECTLHPNKQWSQELAEEILEDADEDVRTTWKSIVQASTLSDEQLQDAEEGAPNDNETVDVVMQDTHSEHRGWRRETGAWKPVPIGVVAG